MSSKDIAIRVSSLSKCYTIYDRPQDRLKQALIPRIKHFLGGQPKNYFHEFWALRDVSFEVEKGETLGIIGRNGSGKSTLLQIICGTLTPTGGTVETNGRVAALLELGSGFNPEFTGRENVYMNGAVLGLSKEEMDARFDEIVTFADIGEFIDQPVKMYSSGMYVRLAFAVSACIDPDILIVDEALAVGDAKFQAKCFRRFDELIQRGTTILFVTHSTEQVVRHCDRSIILDHGQISKIGQAREVVNLYMDMLFGVDDEKKLPLDIRMENNKLLNGTQSISDDTLGADRGAKGQFEARAGYNPYEYRWGNGEAEIVDFCVTSGGRLHTNRIETGQPVVVTIWVKFHCRVEFPIYGLIVKTPDGVTVYGSNSRDFAHGPLYLPAGRGDEYKVRFTLRDQHLGSGEYLLSFGVAKDRDGEIIPLDRRYDAVCVRVDNRLSKAIGLADFSMEVEIEPEREGVLNCCS